MEQSDLIDNTATYAMILSPSGHIAVGVLLPGAYQPPPLPAKNI